MHGPNKPQGGHDDQPTSTVPTSTVRYTVTRLTVRVGPTPGEFQARYEEAVPPWPKDQVMALVDRQAPWQEMLALVTAAAPWGFLMSFAIGSEPGPG